MSRSKLPPVTRVAVIGCGTLGLAQIRQLLDQGLDRSHIVGFEARAEVGGTWTYEADPGGCDIRYMPSGLAVASTAAERLKGAVPPSAMYDSLRTNLPKQVMNFRELEFPPGIDRFPAHFDVHRYLVEYAETFDLKTCIRFSTTVRRLAHSPPEQLRWTIESESGGIYTTEQFSHVVVANGHHSEPFIPYVPGLHNFRGQMMHSRWWRSPVPFKNKKVLVVGSRASGGDITHDLSLQNLALPDGSSDQATIYQSTRGPIKELFPLPVEQWTQQVHALPELDYVSDAGDLHFKDGSTLRHNSLDVIIWATGYSYCVPFANPQDEPWQSHPLVQPREGGAQLGELPADKIDASLRPRGGAQIDNLDPGLQSFYVPDPSIAFIGLAYMVVPFRLSEVQARVIARSWVTQALPKDLPPLVSKDTEASLHTVGFPAEAEAADRWLKAIGEDGLGGTWRATSEEWKRSRARAKEERKEIYGY